MADDGVRPIPAGFVEADLKVEVAALAALLGDTRVRFRHRQTRVASTQALIDLDLEIRGALARPISAALQLDVRRLSARLREIDPH